MSGYASYESDIFSGAVKSKDELQARLATAPGGKVVDPRNQFSTSYFRDSEGRVITENRQVGKPEKSLLLDDFADVKNIADTAAEAVAYASYLKDILSGKISNAQELAARLATIPGNYVVDPRTQFYTSYFRDSEGRAITENRQVGKVQKAGLKEFYTNLESLGESAKPLAKALITGNDATEPLLSLIEKYQASMTAPDASRARTALDLATNVARQWRRSQADKTVTAAILATGGDITTVFPLIRDDTEEDTVDRKRAEDLTALTYKIRRVKFTVDVLQNIAKPDNDVEVTLRQLAEYSDSPDPADKQRAALLTAYTYKAELARAQRMLLSTLSKAGYEGYSKAEGALRLRPGVGDFDYVAEVLSIKNKFMPVVEEVRQAETSMAIADVVKDFRDRTALDIVETIQNITDSTEDVALGEQVLGFYKQYLTNRRETRTADYEQVFSLEVSALRKTLSPDYDFNQNLGNNLVAAKTIAQNFKDVILPLFDALKGEPRYEQIARFTARQVLDGVAGVNRFIQDRELLEKQRPLSKSEVDYLDSVKLLSAFNPYLVGLANINPEITSVYLDAYFKERSQNTFEALETGSYVPVVQVGLGPNGLSSLGEVMRGRPDIASDMLVLDDAELPGGPFGVPKGPAWDLNSANSSGLDGFILPDADISTQAGKRVRDYGSPLRWFPGERNSGRITRPGSINTTVDYLVNPDVISNGRYPTNEDLALVLQLQTAVLADKILLNTRLLSVTDTIDGSGQKEVTVQAKKADGSTTKKTIYTDKLIIASGLGDKYYGFDLDSSKAKRVLDAQDSVDGFPRLSDTLDAFNALASREQDSPIPGKKIVVYGNGNSADTLIEYLGGLFDSNNPNIRNIEKIYVVTTGTLSQRPRYAQISDLRSRNGRGNLVEVINARVGDVDYVNTGEPGDQPLMLFDEKGRIIRDETDNEIVADNVIAATGFRSNLLSSTGPLAGLLKERTADSKLPTEPVVLPTNQNVSVADMLAGRDDILLVGTGSNAAFNVTDKLLQLPPEARSALLRNGAENAVAVGFRAPDTQAAVRLFMETIPYDKNTIKQLIKRVPERVIIDGSDKSGPDPGMYDISKAVESLPSLRQDVLVDSETLTPLLLRKLNNLKLTNTGPDASYSLQLKFDGKKMIVDAADVPTSLRDAVALAAVENPYFLAYGLKAVSTRRGAEGLGIRLSFKNGRLYIRNSYVQAK